MGATTVAAAMLTGAAATAATADTRPVVRKGVWTTSAKKLRLPAAKSGNKLIALRLVLRRDWSMRQFRCLEKLWSRESGWNHRAVNRSSGAYGIPQALPASKMSRAGSDWRTNPATQIRWGLSYVTKRYGTPCRAWAFFTAHNWY
ncbi:transglycosylase SLT domain-containing protein [Bailinhaonella thermotolerans]|uniref:Lytic transglycosylase domain-containing protein n=1 Tax=Bailinhaonella thermotolerans TaxID=1070861 RepID=A0A3A4B6F5_9ACTN|nr:transglycosylase SLT domain-containing protein [Bailinhaonella thermotolerans]RJL34147.1 lytic transglycosylase domain-containing protein [Bailinhaonella thermotolerans]